MEKNIDLPIGGILNDPEMLAKHTFKTYREFSEEKNSPHVYSFIYIDGKEFKGSCNIEIIQHTNNHDTFTIFTRDDNFDSFHGYVMENSKNLSGKNISIEFKKFGELRQTFTGIIGKVENLKNEGGGYGKLIITGFAPSILLESGKDCQSFENKTLEQIIEQIVSEYPQEAKIETKNLNTKRSLPYTVQYKETDYEFIQRLAILHGEYFYYNGQELIFGNKVQPIIKLEEGVDLIDAQFELHTKPQDFSYIASDIDSGEVISRYSSQVQKQYKENPFQAIQINSSNTIFRKKPQMHFNQIGSESELNEAVRKEKEKRENLVLAKGKSKNPELKIGGRAKLIDINDKPMETYRIIEIKHYHDGNKYYNEFVAIPDLFTAPYQDNEAVPVGEIQSARVLENNDPAGIGRVRVQFPWQMAKGEKTPWIHLIQPHSGSGKGFYFIPEIGEEVLVNYESGNAEKPFVMGTKYNEKERSGYHTEGNDLKVIKTRSGIENISNDAEGSWKQSTPDGNFLHFDGHGNAILHIPKNFAINVGGNMSVNVMQNMSQIVGMNSMLTAGTNITMNTPEMKQYIANYFHTEAGKALINSENEIKIEAKETSVSGYKKLFVHSNESATINSKGLVEIKGESGTNQTNIAETVDKILPLIDTRVLVHFRPKSWKGEYGFDWLRGENKELSDSEKYKNLVGKYYQFTDAEMVAKLTENSGTSFSNMFINNDNSWYLRKKDVRNNDITVVNFRPDPQYLENDNTFQKLKDEFSVFNYTVEEKKGTPETFTYYGSYIALFPKSANYGKSEAEINMDITFYMEKKEKPDYLIFKVDNQVLKADHPLIGIDKLKIDKPGASETIKISCKSAAGFDTNKKIEIYAVKVQEDKSEFETLAGCITMIAPKVKKIDVVIVGVKTKADGNPGESVDLNFDFLKKATAQALIQLNIIKVSNGKDFRIDISDTPNFTTRFETESNGEITKTTGFDELLNQKFNMAYPAYADKYKLYFIDVICKEKGETGGSKIGYSNYGANYGVMFVGHTKETIGHEFLHARGLPHSFFYRRGSYVFKALGTANIMDYSHNPTDPATGAERTPKDRYYTWYWQWKIANPELIR